MIRALLKHRAGKILEALGFSEREVDLARIAAFLHDIGNLVNRVDHSQSGAVLAFQLLSERGFAPEEIALVTSAIGNHDEGTGTPVHPIAAALILADKADVRRSRVRNPGAVFYDIHDRVNYSVTRSDLILEEKEKKITLHLDIDPEFSSVMEYFEIFMERMLLCRKAAEKLGLEFGLVIGGQKLL